MNEQANIDELLNSFIDGELTERQRIEVQRLISHDAEAARQCQRLERCRMLVGSLPHAEAPADMLERVRAGLDARRLVLEQSSIFEQRRGAVHLFARKVLTAAAMIGLTAILAVVVYTILAPANKPGPLPPPTIAAEEPPPFYARLELRPSSSAAVNAFQRAIVDNGLSECFTAATEGSKSVYMLTCSRADLNGLLGDLTDTYDRFGSPTLSVETDRFAERVTIRSVTLRQIAEIVDQNSEEKRLQVARDISLSNWMDQLMPGKDIEVALGRENNLVIAKPPIVGPGSPAKKSPAEVKESEKVYLTVVFTGVE